MKTIKNILFLAGMCAVVLLAVGCEKGEDDKKKDPRVENPEVELPDIRSNYSNLTTVYQAYKTDDCSKTGATGEILKIAGWIVQPGGDVEKMDCNAFYLTDKPDQIKIDNAILITATPEVAKYIKNKHNGGLATGDFDKEPDIRQKCYITGEVILVTLNEDGRFFVVPSIKITERENFRIEYEVPPKSFSPIDWDNYNDVYTIYWNYEIDNSILERGPTGKILKAEGWVVPINWQEEIKPYYFKLIDVPYKQIQTQMDWYERYTVYVRTATPKVGEQLRIKIENSDLSKKCYITGDLVIEFMDGAWNGYTPIIEITNADNVIFE